MNVYILDWGGTLDTLGNPKGFVRALQSLGHKVVLWTAQSRFLHPDTKVVEAVDLYVLKGGYLRDLVGDVMVRWPSVQMIYVSDDERAALKEIVLDLRTDPELEYPIEFLEPRDLSTHLTNLAP